MKRYIRGLAIAGFILLNVAGARDGRCQATENERKPVAGDAPSDPGPLATDLSGELQPEAVKNAMRRVADWQLSRIQDTPSRDWTFAALYLGLLAASDTLKDVRYQNAVFNVASHFDWTLGPRKTNADDQAIGQSYLWLYRKDHIAQHIASLKGQFSEIIQIPDDPQKPVWWWCDALFMAPPVWAGLARETGQQDYLDYMHREWRVTASLLWDPEEHLFFRDSSYLNQREKNGRKVFWSRGNGWVMGGLVRILDEMPLKDPRRPFYTEKFREMATVIASIQGEDGLWRPGLLDAADYPNPEISGSSFFVYAMAWGIDHHVLKKQVYLPVVERGWRGLVKHIYADGRLGDIQPIGAAPGAYTPSSSYVFGTGAFLLAGSEVEQIASHVRASASHSETKSPKHGFGEYR
jgi:unsaturated rhamnogalacturonyl hydrolase